MAMTVAVIGAGPYGLSLAAHLRARGVAVRCFGKPMESWRTQMPKGMSLKSDGFASNLSDPGGRMTLGNYCRGQGIPYADVGIPVLADTFMNYGMAFQKGFVPDLDKRMVTAVDKTGDNFTLRLEDGETVTARHVVVAVGITHFANLPAELRHLPKELASHGSEQPTPAKFAGREVIVVGGGASAVDMAALLFEAGADVRLVARNPIVIHDAMRLPRTFLDGLRAPMSGIGPAWRSRFYTDFPHAFHRFSRERRLRTVRTYLGPAAGWFMKDRIAPVPQFAGYNLVESQARGERVMVGFATPTGREEMEADYVIAATGYKVEVARLPFLSATLRDAIALESPVATPLLDSHFESSVRGLHFIGPMAANSFGPMFRFAFGSEFAARRLSAHLADMAERRIYAVDAPRANAGTTRVVETA